MVAAKKIKKAFFPFYRNSELKFVFKKLEGKELLDHNIELVSQA